MKVLIACEFSGRVRDAFRARGHDAWSCDLYFSERGQEHHIRGDFRSAIQDDWDFIGFHYDCRVMANSGVRWLWERPHRWHELEEATETFNVTLRDPRPGYSENSVMHAHARRRIIRTYDQVIQPWQFGDRAFKATCLWLRGLPALEWRNILPPPRPGTDEHRRWSRVHREPPGPFRWKERSRTFPGIANAMAEQWGDVRTTCGLAAG